MLIAMEGPLLKDTESSGYPSGLHRILQCQGSGHERQNLTTKVQNCSLNKIAVCVFCLASCFSVRIFFLLLKTLHLLYPSSKKCLPSLVITVSLSLYHTINTSLLTKSVSGSGFYYKYMCMYCVPAGSTSTVLLPVRAEHLHPFSSFTTTRSCNVYEYIHGNFIMDKGKVL